jgi:CheY-like chemotaxis protein
LLNDVISIIRVRLNEKPVAFVTRIDSSLPSVLNGDETRMRQILLNILSNAVKYTHEGSVTLAIKNTGNRKPAPGETIVLSFEVADTGIGIRAEDKDKLFGEFSRLDMRVNQGIEGTGLGLAITRRLCVLMGGTITMESRYGAGSVFTATVAQTVRDPAPFGGVDDTGYHDAGQPGIRFIAPEARVLIVDDIVTNLNVAEGLMAPYEMKIDCCTGGFEAVHLAEKNCYDVVFVDYMMPGMDGIETAAAIRALDTDYTKNLPLIALTANALSGMREMFLEKGFNGYLSKPIDIAELDDLLGKWIPKAKQREPVFQRDAALPVPAFQIEGVNTARGLTLTGGTETGYRKVLTTFRRDALDRLPRLAEPPAAGELNAFTIEVHALKSAAAAIGAALLSDEAAALEAAGRAGDLAVLSGQLPRFYADLEKMTEAIRAALETGGAERDGGDSAAFPSAAGTPGTAPHPAFAALRTALETQDIGTIDRILAELEEGPMDPGTREILERVSDLVLMAEFEKALLLVDGIVGT